MKRRPKNPPLRPNEGVAVGYARKMQNLIEPMHREVTAALRGNMAMDAKEPAATVPSLRERWLASFDQASTLLARYFATSAAQRSDASFRRILRDGRISVKRTVIPAQQVKLDEIIRENVELIKSIPQEYFDEVTEIVKRAVGKGGDLQSIVSDLTTLFGVTKKRATLIARDQNNKATSALANFRMLDVGITEAYWLHSAGAKNPRPEHVAFSGKKYDIRKGAFLEGKWVWPGSEINCSCVPQPIIPGLDS